MKRYFTLLLLTSTALGQAFLYGDSDKKDKPDPQTMRKRVEQVRKAPDRSRENAPQKQVQAIQQVRKETKQDTQPKNRENFNRKPDTVRQGSADRKKSDRSSIPRSPSMSRTPITPKDNRPASSTKTDRESFRRQIKELKGKDKDRDGNRERDKDWHKKHRDDDKRYDEIRASYKERSRHWHDSSRRASDRIRYSHPSYRKWFRDDFFKERNYYPSYWRNNINWWRGARWPQINLWLGWGSTAPVYYYYGTPVPLNNYQDNTYVDNSVQVDAGDWLPLGVFAAGPDSDLAANGTIFIQLAVNREGDLEGTYFNSSTNQSYPLEGMIDKDSQQAVWRLSNDVTAPVMSTGIYNLAQDSAEIQLTFPNGVVQNWVLVKLEEQ